MAVALVPVDAEHPNRVAVTYGPVVLVRNEDTTLAAPLRDPAAAIRRNGSSLEFSAARQPEGTFVPFFRAGAGVPYSMYFDRTG